MDLSSVHKLNMELIYNFCVFTSKKLQEEILYSTIFSLWNRIRIDKVVNLNRTMTYTDYDVVISTDKSLLTMSEDYFLMFPYLQLIISFKVQDDLNHPYRDWLPI